MRKPKPIPKKKSQNTFKKTSQTTHKKNIPQSKPMRGGIRL
jgi:hypothetical protein